MRILYVAKHNSGDNDDEGAITYALEQLGHEVVKVQEMRRRRRHNASVFDELPPEYPVSSYDFCLFHKWETVSEIVEVAKHIPCAFWYFDLISNDDDPTLQIRMQARRRWFREVMQHCVTAFITDGDWVERWNTGDPRERVAFENEGQTRYTDAKIHWLMQGADERHVGLGCPVTRYSGPEILFTGTRYHGAQREREIAALEARYGSRFGTIGETRQNPRRHGRELADIFASVKVVVAPTGPCTHRYWSNRVYLTLGLGGFLVHPRCAGLFEHYGHNELLLYDSAEELYELLDHLHATEYEHHEWWREAGLRATIQRNLYRHRCAALVSKMQELI